MKNYEDCVIFLLGKAYQKAHGNLKRRLFPYGLTPIQYLVLDVLWEEDDISAGDIGKKLKLDGATISGVLDRMVTGGWIAKETDPQDKRIQRISILQKGKELKIALTGERIQANDEILYNFSVEERVLLKRLLRDVKG